MAVILKDMEMPKSCYQCPLFRSYLGINGVFHNVCTYGRIEMCGDLTNKRHDSCRLIEEGENIEKTLEKIKSEIENEIIPSDGNWSWDTSNIGLRKSIQIIEEHIKNIMEEN